MRKGKKIRDEISFNGVDGLSSPELIQAVRNRAFEENKTNDRDYMVTVASLCFTGPALKWFEHLGDNEQGDWSQLRRALLARFPDKEDALEPLIFTGENPKDSGDFVRSIRQHSHAEGKAGDDEWVAHYAAGCMAGEALKWHTTLDKPVRKSWFQVERALLLHFPEPPPYALPPAGRILVESWEPMQVPAFLPRTEEAWLTEARRKRAAYDEAGCPELHSVHWLLVNEGESIPDIAIKIGVDSGGGPLFGVRTWYQNGLHPGTFVQYRQSISITYDGKAILLQGPYEILVGDPSAVRWISNPWIPSRANDVSRIQFKSFHAVESGCDNKMSFFLAQTCDERYGFQPAKTAPGWRGCEVERDDEMFVVEDFRILIWVE